VCVRACVYTHRQIYNRHRHLTDFVEELEWLAEMVLISIANGLSPNRSFFFCLKKSAVWVRMRAHRGHVTDFRGAKIVHLFAYAFTYFSIADDLRDGKDGWGA
jgi:hypothetical protein